MFWLKVLPWRTELLWLSILQTNAGACQHFFNVKIKTTALKLECVWKRILESWKTVRARKREFACKSILDLWFRNWHFTYRCCYITFLYITQLAFWDFYRSINSHFIALDKQTDVESLSWSLARAEGKSRFDFPPLFFQPLLKILRLGSFFCIKNSCCR